MMDFRPFAPSPSALATACALLLVCAAPAAMAADPMPPGSAPAREAGVRFVITSGDTLSQIGQQVLAVGSTWGEVARLNRLPDANRIRSGQTLWIPARLMRAGSQPATLESVSGPVSVVSATGELPLTAGQALLVGQVLVTGPLGSATLRLGDGSVVEVQPGSRTQITTNRILPTSTRADTPNLFISGLRLLQGSIEVLATKVLRGTPLAVETPTAVIGVRGTQYRVHADGGEYPTRTEVLEGRVAVDQGKTVRDLPVQALQGAAMAPSRAPQVVPLPAAPRVEARAQNCPGVAWQITPDARPQASPIVASDVVISADAAGRQVKWQQRVAGSQPYTLPADLPAGVWYARVASINALGLLGLQQTTRFEVSAPETCREPAPPPTPGVDPAPALTWLGTTRSLQVDLPAAALAGTASQASTTVQIARDAAFSQKIYTQPASGPRWIIGAPGSQGEVFVRYQRPGQAPSAVARLSY